MYFHIITSSSNLYVKLNRFVLFFDFSIRFNLVGAIVFGVVVIVDLQHSSTVSVHKIGMINLEHNRFSGVFTNGAKKRKQQQPQQCRYYSFRYI